MGQRKNKLTKKERKALNSSFNYFESSFDDIFDAPSDETTEFICSKCGAHEDIPINVVRYLDQMDYGDSSVPPRFDCEKCGSLMYPVNYTGINGQVYQYKSKE